MANQANMACTTTSSLGGRRVKSRCRGEGAEIYILVGGEYIVGGGREGLLERFAPFSYFSHSFILSLNVKICIRFIVFLQISVCFFICQELCWVRGLCISVTSSCFLFPVRGGNKKFEDCGG